ncbi:MAG TPA: phosphoribosylpyrophosphate synthetase [Cytophagales bacterium]|jgi:hypothetical protein
MTPTDPQTAETLSEAIELLRRQGYADDFNLRASSLYCVTRRVEVEPDALHVDGVYRFEGMTNPDDEAILYAISSAKYGLKGVLVNAYGVYADALTAELEQKLRFS